MFVVEGEKQKEIEEEKVLCHPAVGLYYNVRSPAQKPPGVALHTRGAEALAPALKDQPREKDFHSRNL